MEDVDFIEKALRRALTEAKDCAARGFGDHALIEDLEAALNSLANIREYLK